MSTQSHFLSWRLAWYLFFTYYYILLTLTYMLSSVLPIYCTSVTVLLLPALPLPLFPRALFRPSTYFCCLPPCFSSVASVRLLHPFRIHVHLRRSRHFHRNILISVTFSFSSSIFFIAHFFPSPYISAGLSSIALYIFAASSTNCTAARKNL